MRKIKTKPFKPPRKLKPSPNVEYVACLPIEGVLFNLNEFERHDRRQTWQRMQAWFRGEPVQSEEWT